MKNNIMNYLKIGAKIFVSGIIPGIFAGLFYYGARVIEMQIIGILLGLMGIIIAIGGTGYFANKWWRWK